MKRSLNEHTHSGRNCLMMLPNIMVVVDDVATQVMLVVDDVGR